MIDRWQDEASECDAARTVAGADCHSFSKHVNKSHESRPRISVNHRSWWLAATGTYHRIGHRPHRTYSAMAFCSAENSANLTLEDPALSTRMQDCAAIVVK
jgi:hypothetical protein